MQTKGMRERVWERGGFEVRKLFHLQTLTFFSLKEMDTVNSLLF